ncbi:MAG: hypothetical protein NTY61_00070, partial [Candidatus Parcubacteria bacterium]|nr:hypothetical protein [Candidatus Parcubacteria bacterium]
MNRTIYETSNFYYPVKKQKEGNLGKHKRAPLTPIGGHRRGRWGLTNHHCIPRIRHGPSTWANLRLKTIKEHSAWHDLFRNMTPDEVMASIQERGMVGITRHDNFLTGCWRIIFGNKT